MKKQLQKFKLLSILLIVIMTINLATPAVFAIEVIPEKAVAKPLVIMMNYQDYKFSDIDSKETARRRKFPGSEFTPEFVQAMLFGEKYYIGEDGQQFMSVRKYFDDVTSGSYSFNGKVVGPYTASHDASYYGVNNGGSDQDEAMLLIREAVEAVAKDPNVDLSEFDVENRTGDGEFNKPDGVIDTVIVIHPGMGEEWGGGSLGKDAIWPFRCGFSWYYENDYKMENIKDHNNKDWKFDDFVVMAQDAASDLLIHEYGHVMGLPDLYGFSENTPPVEYWSIMGGSYTGKDIIGTMPVSYGAYCRELLQSIFLKKKVQKPNWANSQKEDFSNICKDGIDLELHQSHERIDGKTDLYRIDLPIKETIMAVPASGEYAYFSGNKNNARTSMKTTIDLTNYEKAKLEFKTWYDIDPLYDFASVRVNEVGSGVFETVNGNITTTKIDGNISADERLERNPGYGISEKSDGWVNAEFDLSKYAGKKIELKFYFWSDDNTPQEGIYLDDIVVSGVVGTCVSGSGINGELADPKSKVIELGKKNEGSFTEKDSVHHYELTLSEPKNLNISAKADENMEVTWAMYNKVTSSVAIVALPGDLKSEIPAGTYDFVIFAGGKNKVGNYSFTASEKTVQDKPDDPNAEWVTILEDGAEGEPKFNISGGFIKTPGKANFDHYYLLEWRNSQVGKVDEGLSHVYYKWPQIGYDPGLLVWYINDRWRNDEGKPNQQTNDHPGECFAGVVDADQNPVGYDYKDGNYYEDKGVNLNMHDAAFSLKMENNFCHDWGGGTITRDKNTFMVPDFDDSRDYTRTVDSTLIGLKLTNYGLNILVTDQVADGSSAKIHIMNSKLQNSSVDYGDGLNVKGIMINGNSIEVKAENKGLTDDLGEKAYICYTKDGAKGNAIEAKEVLVLKDGEYRCSTDFLSSLEKGKYHINFIVLEDSKGNSRAIYNSKVYYGYGKDLSAGDIYTNSGSGGSGNSNNPVVNTTNIDEKNDKIELKLDSNSNSFVIDPKIIKSIVDNKKDLEITSQGLKLNIKNDLFEKYKEFPVKLKLELENKERGGEYIQVFPSINVELNAIIGDKVEKINLNKKTTISVNFSEKIGLNYEKACFYRVDENGNLVFLGGKLNKDTKTIECEIDRLGQYEVLINDKTFKDIDIEWARNPIEVLAARHIIDGMDKDNFKPNNNITRAEFCKMIMSTLDVELVNNHIEFKDVDKNKWYYDYVNSAASLGLVEGYDGMFNPDDFITREAMVVMISRAAKLEKYGQIKLSGNMNFNDSSSISDWSKDAVSFAKDNGIINGTGNNNFEPKKNATRAEIAVIIYKTLKLKGTI